MNRQPAVAGFFYPADPGQLSAMVEQFLMPIPYSSKVPKAIIVPHAGYPYSGPIAATAYARLQGATDRITRVVLIGPSHRLAFKGIAVSHADAFDTPLGSVPVDKQSVQLITQLPFVGFLEQAHAQEHSLEVHLPFLQTILDEFEIVPIVTGDASADQVSQVVECLWGGEETLVVVSSDLSHYHDYTTAQQLDLATSQSIEELSYEKLDFESACGRVPVSGLLKLVRDKKLSIKMIDLRNSGDTAGDKTRVVGYGAYVVD